MIDLAALKSANENRWAGIKLFRRDDFVAVANSLVGPKQRYITVSLKTNVPWFVIAVIHERESSQRWERSLAQGDLWNRVSTHVPKGRGPFKSWEAAAIDALVNCAPHLAMHKDWTVGGALVALETYNGTGYAMRGLPSPYLWAGSSAYKSGKYVKDGKFDPKAIDKQLGCAGLLVSMMQLDPTIAFATPKGTSDHVRQPS